MKLNRPLRPLARVLKEQLRHRLARQLIALEAGAKRLLEIVERNLPRGLHIPYGSRARLRFWHIALPQAQALVDRRRRTHYRYRDADAFRAAVEHLTNWERTQWARRGYQGLQGRDPEGPGRYAGMAQERKAAAA